MVFKTKASLLSNWQWSSVDAYFYWKCLEIFIVLNWHCQCLYLGPCECWQELIRSAYPCFAHGVSWSLLIMTIYNVLVFWVRGLIPRLYAPRKFKVGIWAQRPQSATSLSLQILTISGHDRMRGVGRYIWFHRVQERCTDNWHPVPSC